MVASIIFPALIPVGASGYTVENAVYFDGTADRLTFDPSGATSNPDLYCISYWAKRGRIGGADENVMSGGRSGFDSTIRYTNYSTYRDAIQFYANGGPDRIITNAAFADPTAWHHVFARYDSNASGGSSDYMQLWVNGVRLSSFADSGMPSTGEDSTFFDGNIIGVGGYNLSAQQWFAGYLAEVAASDGQDHAATDFGEYDDNGVWVPKDPSGLDYGTNGFLLQFKQTGSGQDANGIGADTSGNNNHFAIAGGSPQSQQVTDTCTDNAASDIGNYATLNPLDLGSSTALSEGNLRCTSGSNFFDNNYAFSTIAMVSDKFYVTSLPTDTGKYLGIANASVTSDIATANDVHIYWDSSAPRMVYWNGSNNNLTPSPTEVRGTDQLGIALNATNGDYWIGWYDISGSAWYWYNSSASNWTGNPDSDSGKSGTLSGGPYRFLIGCNASGTHDIDFGQGALWDNISKLTTFKELNTANLPASTVVKPDDHFGILLWSGDNASTRDIVQGASGVTGNVDFTPDFCWIKGRNVSARNKLYDVNRGTSSGKDLNTDQSSGEDAETTNGYVSDFKAGGVEITRQSNSYYYNDTGTNYVGYFWKAGGSPQSNSNGSITSSVSAASHGGFSIVTYSGVSGAGTVGHGLSRDADFVMIKDRGNARNWQGIHKDLTSGAYNFSWNTTDGQSNSTNYFNSLFPGAAVINLGDFNGVNGNGLNYVAYCWARTPGLIATGKYVGDNELDGPLVHIDDLGFGFRPAWVMIKRIDTSTTHHWRIWDSARSPHNIVEDYISASSPNQEYGAGVGKSLDFLANGFKIRTQDTDMNADGGNYIYLCFAEHPFGGDGVSQAKAR